MLFTVLRAILLLSFVASVQAIESSVIINDFGTELVPIDETITIFGTLSLSSFMNCIYACHMNYFCRVFDFDSVSRRCRLFEGDIPTTGSINSSSSSTSVVGQIVLHPDQFAAYGHPCSACSDSRYLICINYTCTCFPHTYWTGSICASQNLLGGPCSNPSHCRTDINHTCLQFFQCGPPSLLMGTTIFGSANGSVGNTSSTLDAPWGITINADNTILIADAFNKRVILARQSANTAVRIACDGGVLSGPAKAMFDATSSKMFILDGLGSRMMLWSNSSGTCVTLFGSSAGSSLSQLYNPHGFYLDSQQNFYIADRLNHRILFWPMNASSGVIVAGVTGVAGSGSLYLNLPTDVFVDEVQSLMYVADYNNHRIVRYTLGSPNGTVVAGGNGAGTARNQCNSPIAVCLSKTTGALYIAEQMNHRVTRWYPGDSQGVVIAGSPAGLNGTSSSLFKILNGISLDDNETYLFVSDRNNHRIQRFKLINKM